MRAEFDGVGPRVLIGAEALAGGTEQSQQHHGKGLEQEQPVTALWIAYASRTHPPAETQVLGVPEARLDAPALGAMLDQGPEVGLRVAGGRTPRRLHGLGVHTHDDARIIPVCRDPRMAQSCGAISCVYPIGRGLALALSIGHGDIAAQANDVIETMTQTHGHHRPETGAAALAYASPYLIPLGVFGGGGA